MPQRFASRNGCLWNSGDAVVDKSNTAKSAHRFQTVLQGLEGIEIRDEFPNIHTVCITRQQRRLDIQQVMPAYQRQGRAVD